ncbi:MAG: universal stress protein [Mangrovibacterium sp.]
MKEQAITTAVNKVLIPITLTKEGKTVIARAVNFHKRYNCEVTLLLSVDEESELPNWLNQFFKNRSALLPAEDQLRMFVCDNLDDYKVPEYMHLVIMPGSMMGGVKRVQQKDPHDLLLLNKRLVTAPEAQDSWENNIKLAIQEAHCPVLTYAGGKNPIRANKILLPIDLFQPYRGKLIWAERLAHTYNANVHIVSAIKNTLVLEETAVYRKIKDARFHLEQSGIKTETTVLMEQEGKTINQMIPEFINETKADLTVLMTHQESIFDFNYIGRVASEVILKTDTPIFCIAPEKYSLF